MEKILTTPVVIFKLLVNVFSVLPSVTDSNYLCGIFKLLVNVLSVLPLVRKSNYPCGVFKLLVNVLPVLHSVTDSNYPCSVTEGRTENTFTNSLKITTGVVRICNGKKNRKHIYQKFEDNIIPVVSSIFWEMYCLFSIQFQILITPVVYSNFW
jgi:hypothetical protein